ncbi:hypothetical protein [Streptomyces sp. NPDC048611]|uniref:hypothetical protein n=1 Tax=unclassified Streptomyces TaxID=2593676 RepID=UPI00342D72A6
MLPTMAEHGCPPEHHTTNIKADGTHVQHCHSCGYTITHERPGGDANALPGAPARFSARNTHGGDRP